MEADHSPARGLPAVKVAGRELTRAGSGGGDGGSAPVLVIGLDATVIQAASTKEGAETNYKGWGFHPMTGWCSNTGENLAIMNRPGSAGSFTAADHVDVLDAALEQVPAGHRRDMLVTTDGAGASHEFIDHLQALNTAAGMAGGDGAWSTPSVGPWMSAPPRRSRPPPNNSGPPR